MNFFFAHIIIIIPYDSCTYWFIYFKFILRINRVSLFWSLDNLILISKYILFFRVLWRLSIILVADWNQSLWLESLATINL